MDGVPIDKPEASGFRRTLGTTQERRTAFQ
jgi:hypothetical protein